jgi:copper chaperone CopZ
VERVDGVSEAWFSYNTAEGFVTFDTTVISPTEFIGELERMTAFTATLREEDDGPS